MHVSASKRSTDFIALLEKLDHRYGPKPGRTVMPVVLVLDHGPIHTSRLTCAAIAERPWLTIEWLPRYTPELNDIERSWRDLKRPFLAHRTFPSVEHLEFAIKHAIIELNREGSAKRVTINELLLRERRCSDHTLTAGLFNAVRQRAF